MGERVERDALGEVRVPEDAYYGPETVRAVENFRISGRPPRPGLIRALVLVKAAAARANAEIGALDGEVAGAIERAANEVLDGGLAGHFLVDPYQAGAGTSTHMNVNEVLANRAEELLGGRLGAYERVHPNDHVNLGQSSNDVFPTAVRLALLEAHDDVGRALDNLSAALRERGEAFAGIVKSGRTHLQDAVPITLGREFAAYAAMVERARGRLEQTARERLARLPIGGTAVGTGFGATPGYHEAVLRHLRELTGLDLAGAEDLVEAVRNLGDLGEFAGDLKSVATTVGQVANDLRLLSMG